MRTRLQFTGVLFALCTMLAGAPAANAGVLIQDQGTTTFSMSDFGVYSEYQPFAQITVGSADVMMGGFGVWGAAEAAGQIKFLVFDQENLIYSSASIAATQTQTLRWYDSPVLSIKLSKDHTYSLGVVSNNMFAWGRYDESGFATGLQNGLNHDVRENIVQVSLTGNPGSNYAGNPFLVPEYGVDYFQSSVRVFDLAGGGVAPPIPEPAEWSMLLAGLLVVAFVANRQRRRPV